MASIAPEVYIRSSNFFSVIHLWDTVDVPFGTKPFVCRHHYIIYSAFCIYMYVQKTCTVKVTIFRPSAPQLFVIILIYVSDFTQIIIKTNDLLKEFIPGHYTWMYMYM